LFKPAKKFGSEFKPWNYVTIATIIFATANTIDNKNFQTQNHNRSSKVSKDSDCSLVSYKNFSEILPSNGLGPGPGEVGQGGLKASTYDVTHKKSTPPNQKTFFERRLEDLPHLLSL